MDFRSAWDERWVLLNNLLCGWINPFYCDYSHRMQKKQKKKEKQNYLSICLSCWSGKESQLDQIDDSSKRRNTHPTSENIYKFVCMSNVVNFYRRDNSSVFQNNYVLTKPKFNCRQEKQCENITYEKKHTETASDL